MKIPFFLFHVIVKYNKATQQMIKVFACQTFIEEQAPAGLQVSRKSGQNRCLKAVIERSRSQGVSVRLSFVRNKLLQENCLIFRLAIHSDCPETLLN